MLLVVERNPKFSERLKQLSIEGLRTFVVETIGDAHYLLDSAHPKFLLVNLDACASLDETRTLRKYGLAHGVPVLFIAGFPKTESLRQELENEKGAQLIHLPFTLGDLTKRIKRLMSTDDPLIGETIGPPGQEMKIIRKLGAGAMGSVFEAIQTALDRRVAVKFLSQEFQKQDRDSAARFANEAKAMAKMRSPHIAQVYFVGTHRGVPYLVMEFISGPDLDTHLKRKGAINPLDALTLCRQILTGLGHAHDNGRIHRDIKPANIMLTADHHAVILDFGLARDTTGQKMTQTGIVMGTPRYLSPEQVNGQPLDNRTDIYALGIVLFEMLLGEPPFTGDDYVSVLMKHVKDPLPRPEDLGKTLDPRLYQMIEMFTRKNPDDRYQSAQEAIDAIDTYLADTSQGTLNRQPSATEKSIGELETVASEDLSEPSKTSGQSPRLNVSQMLTYQSEYIPDDVLQELLDIYTEFLGPFARKLAEKQAREVGLKLDKVQARHWPTLLNCLSARIEMERKREAFLDRAILLKKRF